MRRLESVLPWLPVVLAVSANSPYLDAAESGLASARAEILELLPRAGGPPAFASYDEWEAFAERLVRLGLADEHTRIWWDVRPHPQLGTLEVRMPDQPTRLEATRAIAALVHALVRAEPAAEPADRGLYAQNRWAALRFGRDAELVHPDGSRLAGVLELLDELGDSVGHDVVAPLRDLDQAGEQLRIGRSGGLDSVCRELVALT
jgi:carboxylate-amine ligase